jgi:hypothetical protein
MRKEDAPRFAPGHWATLRDSGEHVKVELWSAIAAAYRVRSRKHGLQFAGETELAEISAHPEVHLGKHWRRCQASGCGAPLTPELAICPHCHAPVCVCGRCQCVGKPVRAKTVQAKTVRAKTVRKKTAAKAQ